MKGSKERLSQRVVKGGIWVFALRIVQQGLSLIRLIVLGRMLAPHDFGLMGIALLTMATLDTFSQTGFHVALIQKKKSEEYLDSAWTITILRGIILFFLLYFLAPYVAVFFKSPKALPVIRVLGFSFLIQAFTNIGVICFQKELEFNKQFIYQLTGTIADFTVAISAALLLRNVWALVFGLTAGNMARLVVSYFIHPYRPRISFEFDKVKELFGFGKWILGSRILIFLLTQGDDAFVGKFLGPAMLGFYQMAYRISNMPATEVTHVISQVTFPAYSKLQDDIPKLREAYLKVLQSTAFVSIPVAGMIFALAPDFTGIFLGEKWMPMVPAMQALCIFGVTRSINATFGPIFQGIGKPDILTKTSAVQLVIMALLIYPLTVRWGILGVSIAIIIPNALVLGYLAKRFVNDILFESRSIIKALFLPFMSTIIMLLSISSLPILGRESFKDFFFCLAGGIIIYFIGIYFMDKVFKFNLMETVNKLIKY